MQTAPFQTQGQYAKYLDNSFRLVLFLKQPHEQPASDRSWHFSELQLTEINA